MIGVPFELAHDDNSPVNLLEEFAQSKGWQFNRVDDLLITIALPGNKTTFEASLEWQEEFCSLLIAVSLPLEIAEANHEMAVQAMEKINQNMWLGHFDLSNRNKFPTFRHNLLLRMVPSGIGVDLAADVLDIAIAECNRFYSTFQLAQAGDARLHDDLHAAVFETIGEA